MSKMIQVEKAVVKPMTAEILLDYPVEIDGVSVGHLTMRRPKVRDKKVSDAQGGTEAEREATFFANLCMVSPKVIDELDLVDYAKLGEAFLGFLNRN